MINDFKRIDSAQAKVFLVEAGPRVLASLPEYPDDFVIGDMAAIKESAGKFVPGLAPAAIQAGKHAAREILFFSDRIQESRESDQPVGMELYVF